MEKLQGFEFWRKTLRAARFVLAPMVDQSELAWRLLSRRHGAELCYTPMLHAQVFVRDANYRRENLYNEVSPEDRPLITQVSSDTPVSPFSWVIDMCAGADYVQGESSPSTPRGGTTSPWGVGNASSSSFCPGLLLCSVFAGMTVILRWRAKRKRSVDVSIWKYTTGYTTGSWRPPCVLIHTW